MGLLCWCFSSERTLRCLEYFSMANQLIRETNKRAGSIVAGPYKWLLLYKLIEEVLNRYCVLHKCKDTILDYFHNNFSLRVFVSFTTPEWHKPEMCTVTKSSISVILNTHVLNMLISWLMYSVQGYSLRLVSQRHPSRTYWLWNKILSWITRRIGWSDDLSLQFQEMNTTYFSQ